MARSRSARPKAPSPGEGEPEGGAVVAPAPRKRAGRSSKHAGPSLPGPTEAAARARLEAESMRQAECAAMLVAVTRMLLDLRGRDYARWLRSIADDFEASDPEAETPEDLARDLIRLSREGDGAARSLEQPDAEPGPAADGDEPEPLGAPPGRTRHH